MYQAMSSLGFAAESPYRGPIDLQGAPRGASVLVLGAGMAGMTAAYELRNAGYQVQVLEFNGRAGGRNWSLRGGDTYTELGGATQHCEFDKDLYINPGPWRIPYHHRGMLNYCKRLGVPLEAFVQVNYNAYLHNSRAFGGKPRRYREIKADYQGHVAELLAKATQQNALDAAVSKEDREKLLESLQAWGALDRNYSYVASNSSSERRGYLKHPGGGLTARPIPSEPIGLGDILDSRLWEGIPVGDDFDMQTALFQPVGGMGRVGEAFGRELGPLIRYNSKVIQIQQDEHGVTATYEDTGTSRNEAHRQGGLVRVHDSAADPRADPDECRPVAGRGDRSGAVRLGCQSRPAVQAPLLGGGRSHLRRHQLYRSPDHQHRLPEYRLSQWRQGCTAGRLHLGPQCDGIHCDGSAGPCDESRRIRKSDSPAVPEGIR